MSNSPRRFSEEEASAILGHVIRRSSERAGQEPDNTGLTLEDLQRIAQEAGLDPDDVAAAAQLMPHSSGEEKFYLSGGPPYTSMEIAVPGEVSSDTWNTMLLKIRETYASAGKVTEDDGRYEFTTAEEQGGTVRVTSSDGKTRINVSRSYRIVTFSTYFVLMTFGILLSIGLAVNIGALTNAILGVLSGLLVLLAIAGAGRAYLARNARKDKKRMTQLLQSLGQIASAGKTATAVQSAPAEIEDRLQQGT